MRQEAELASQGELLSQAQKLGMKSLCCAPWLGSTKNNRVVLVQAQQFPGLLDAPGSPELTVGENGHSSCATDGIPGMELPEENIPTRQAVQSKLAGHAHQ